MFVLETNTPIRELSKWMALLIWINPLYWRKENEFTESTYHISEIDTYNFSMRVATSLECPEDLYVPPTGSCKENLKVYGFRWIMVCVGHVKFHIT